MLNVNGNNSGVSHYVFSNEKAGQNIHVSICM